DIGIVLFFVIPNRLHRPSGLLSSYTGGRGECPENRLNHWIFLTHARSHARARRQPLGRTRYFITFSPGRPMGALGRAGFRFSVISFQCSVGGVGFWGGNRKGRGGIPRPFLVLAFGQWV